MTQAATIKVKAQVCGYTNWLTPEKVNFKAIPRAFTLITCRSKTVKS